MKQSIPQYESSVKSLSINQMKLILSNTEIGAESLDDVGFGAIKWPGGSKAFKPLVWFDGLQLVGEVNGQTEVLIRASGGLYHRVQPGKMFDDGTPTNPENPRNKTYKIQRGWETLPFGDLRDDLESDFNQWPVEDGASWIDIDGDGFFSRGVDQPDYIGDEHVFFVANDADSSLKSGVLTGNIYSLPFGIEFQVSAFAFQGTGVLGDVVFRKIKMINKSGKTIKDFITSWYSFLSIGGMPDDGVGIDTVRNFVYGYNRDRFDDEYENFPPAFGYVFLENPIIESSNTDSAFFNGRWNKGYKNIELMSFNFFRGYEPVIPLNDPYYEDKLIAPYNVESFLNTINGKTHNGRPLIDPNTGRETVFPLAGDPVEETGWYDLLEGWGGDTVHISNSFKQFQIALRPFDFAPFDTQTVVVANVVAQGEDNIDSIIKLREKVNSVRNAYYNNFFIIPDPSKPQIYQFTENNKFTLWWESNAENYDEFDPFLKNQNLSDTTYTFEGYLIEQYADSLGNDPEIVSIIDKTNGVTVIEDNIIVNGVSVTVPVIFGNDRGITRFYSIDKDEFTGKPLLNGQEYYFGIRAYAYSQFSSPKFKISPIDVIKIVPGKHKIDFSSIYKHDENIHSNQIEGITDANVLTKIVDPSAITKDSYIVEFHDATFGLSYDLINETKNDTLDKTNYKLNTELKEKHVYDGFLLLVDDFGKDSINAIDPNRTHAVKEILEIRNEEGYLDTPTKLLNNYNSTNRWKFRIGGVQFPKKSHLNYAENIGYNTYEIRFTEEGSEYYTTGYSPLFFFRNDDPKGKGRLPFEIWQISRDGKETKRLIIKVFDQTLRDTAWTKDETTNMWERFYCYEPDGEYPEVFPETSGRSFSAQHRVGNIVFEGEQPKVGTIIRITTFRPLSDGDVFEITLEAPNFNDTESGKEKIDEISVFPNPFFAGNNITNQNYVRFIGLPTKATIRIFTLSGQIVRRMEKDDQTKYVDWDLRNESNQIVAGGMYIAHLEMPGIGTKILKVAIIPSKEFLDIR
ncbi:MAG: T9SS type A sorting domain-containing protein [Melioribacteraceae bacterium]|nr:MAG: T9SS type A sorting domain-containing protein [Melioribacteraceae bacterium]